MNQHPKKQISVREASEIYSIPVWTLRTYIARRLIPHRRVRRKIYIPVARFEEWLSSGDVELNPQKEKNQQKAKERIKNK